MLYTRHRFGGEGNMPNDFYFSPSDQTHMYMFHSLQATGGISLRQYETNHNFDVSDIFSTLS